MSAYLRTAARPSWLGGLVVAIASAAVCALLGRWQWDKSQSLHGDLQNLVYAFNWWLFAALALGVWGKALRDDVRIAAEGAPVRVAVPSGFAAPLVVAEASDDPEVAEWNAWLAELNGRAR